MMSNRPNRWNCGAAPPSIRQRRGENLYGRGASDMKGQVMITLKAVEASG